jgi:hypothetical protein
VLRPGAQDLSPSAQHHPAKPGPVFVVPHSTMSKQAIDSEKVRVGLKDVLLGPAQLYEALRDRGGQQGHELPKGGP